MPRRQVRGVRHADRSEVYATQTGQSVRHADRSEVYATQTGQSISAHENRQVRVYATETGQSVCHRNRKGCTPRRQVTAYAMQTGRSQCMPRKTVKQHASVREQRKGSAIRESLVPSLVTRCVCTVPAGRTAGLRLTLNVETEEYMAGPLSGSGAMVRACVHVCVHVCVCVRGCACARACEGCTCARGVSVLTCVCCVLCV